MLQTGKVSWTLCHPQEGSPIRCPLTSKGQTRPHPGMEPQARAQPCLPWPAKTHPGL